MEGMSSNPDDIVADNYQEGDSVEADATALDTFHVEIAAAGRLQDNDVDALCGLGYVGWLGKPAVFSRFVDGKDMGAAVAAALTEVTSAIADAEIVSVIAITEAHWDQREAAEAARMKWLRENAFRQH